MTDPTDNGHIYLAFGVAVVCVHLSGFVKKFGEKIFSTDRDTYSDVQSLQDFGEFLKAVLF